MSAPKPFVVSPAALIEMASQCLTAQQIQDALERETAGKDPREIPRLALSVIREIATKGVRR